MHAAARFGTAGSTTPTQGALLCTLYSFTVQGERGCTAHAVRSSRAMALTRGVSTRKCTPRHGSERPAAQHQRKRRCRVQFYGSRGVGLHSRHSPLKPGNGFDTRSAHKKCTPQQDLERPAARRQRKRRCRPQLHGSTYLNTFDPHPTDNAEARAWPGHQNSQKQPG